jgi:hypothetical protein
MQLTNRGTNQAMALPVPADVRALELIVGLLLLVLLIGRAGTGSL